MLHFRNQQRPPLILTNVIGLQMRWHPDLYKHNNIDEQQPE